MFHLRGAACLMHSAEEDPVASSHDWRPRPPVREGHFQMWVPLSRQLHGPHGDAPPAP